MEWFIWSVQVVLAMWLIGQDDRINVLQERLDDLNRWRAANSPAPKE